MLRLINDVYSDPTGTHVRKKVRAVTVAVRDDENKSRLFIIDERKKMNERAGKRVRDPCLAPANV